MKYALYGAIGIAVLAYLFLGSNQKAKIDLSQVLQRSTAALDQYDKYLKRNNIEKATDKHLEELNKFLQKQVNRDPKLRTGLIATRLGKDAKFTGVDDANQDGVAGNDERMLFTLELDAERKRLIATDASGTATSSGFSGMGFIAGALIGSMIGRQRAAGVTPNSFANRKVTTPRAYSAARSRARSGGLRGGK